MACSATYKTNISSVIIYYHLLSLAILLPHLGSQAPAAGQVGWVPTWARVPAAAPGTAAGRSPAPCPASGGYSLQTGHREH